ncbi:unnamed protein product, partial [Hymenolepis diminuta]
CYTEIRLKLLSASSKHPDAVLQNLVNEYNFRGLITKSNMTENNETWVCQIKKSEIYRSSKNNPILQPQTQQTYLNKPNNKPGADFVAFFTCIKIVLPLSIGTRIVIRMDTRKNSVRLVNDEHILASREFSIRINIARRIRLTLGQISPQFQMRLGKLLIAPSQMLFVLKYLVLQVMQCNCRER